MKRQQWLKRTYRKFDNLAELVRNRSRYHPYGFRRNTCTLCRVRSTHDNRGISNHRNSVSNADSLPKWHRSTTSSRRSIRSGRRRISLRDIVDVYEERALNGSHAASSSVHTQSERYSRSSVATDISNILLDNEDHDEVHEESEVDEKKEEAATKTTDSVSSTSRDKFPEKPSKLSADEIPSSSSSIETTTDRLNHAQLESRDQLASDNLTNLESSDAEEDEEYVEDIEPNDVMSVFEVNDEESVSDNTIGESRLAEEEMAGEAPLIADEEAGGDGHHNNSVIEIEITLTSGNDTNSDDEDEPDADEAPADDQESD